jgi:hypothetical protein
MSLTTRTPKWYQSRRAMVHRHRLALEPLEARSLLDSGLANILVNDPTLDTTAQDTQSERRSSWGPARRSSSPTTIPSA